MDQANSRKAIGVRYRITNFDYKIGYEEAAEYSRYGIAQLLKQRPMKEWVKLTGIPRQTLYDVINGAKPNSETRREILITLLMLQKTFGS